MARLFSRLYSLLFQLFISSYFVSAKYVILHREKRVCNIGKGRNLVYDLVALAVSSCYLWNSNSFCCSLKRKFLFLWRMDSVKTHHCSAPTITAPHPPSLPLEGPWVANRIHVVLVCLPSHIRLKNRNFVPLMER